MGHTPDCLDLLRGLGKNWERGIRVGAGGVLIL